MRQVACAPCCAPGLSPARSSSRPYPARNARAGSSPPSPIPTPPSRSALHKPPIRPSKPQGQGAILDADIPAGRRRLSRKQSDGWQKSRQAPMSFGRHTPPTRRFQGIAVPGRRHGYGEPAYSNFDVIGANDLVPALAPRCGCAWQTRRMCFEPPTALARLTNTGDAAKAVVRRGPGPNQKKRRPMRQSIVEVAQPREMTP